MYNIVRISDHFFDNSTIIDFYRDGKLVATRIDHEPIRLIPQYSEPIELTQAQGFKYWSRHFSGRTCWDIPQALQDALNRPSKTKGSYIDRNGEQIAYEG